MQRTTESISVLNEVMATVERTSEQCRHDIQSIVADRIRRQAPELLRPVTSGDLVGIRAAAAELRDRVSAILCD